MKKIYLFLSILLSAPIPVWADIPPEVRQNLPLLMTKQVWEINDYLVQAGIANSSYVHYPECNDVAVFFTEKERNQIEVLETEYVNKLLKQYNNCICRYAWFNDTDVATMSFGAAQAGGDSYARMFGIWPGRARTMPNPIEYYEGNVRHHIKWWDEDVMEKDECKTPTLLETDSKRERKRKLQEIREHTCFYPRGFEEYRIHWELGPNEEIMKVFYDNKASNIRKVDKWSLLKNTDTGFYKLDYWTAVYNYTEYYAWMNQKQQDIKDGMYPVVIDPTMLCDSDAQCLEQIKQANPDATDLEKYPSMQRFPRRVQLYQVNPFTYAKEKKENQIP